MGLFGGTNGMENLPQKENEKNGEIDNVEKAALEHPFNLLFIILLFALCFSHVTRLKYHQFSRRAKCLLTN
jgi:hypothetical protein